MHEFAHIGRVKYVLQTVNLLSCMKWTAEKTFKPTTKFSSLLLRWLFSHVHHSAVTQFIKKLLLALVSFVWSANIVIAICSCEPEWQHKKQVKQTIFLLQHAICAFFCLHVYEDNKHEHCLTKASKESGFSVVWHTKNSEWTNHKI